MITRRKLVLALGAGALTPIASFGQQPARVYRIGLLLPSSASGVAPLLEALRAGLRDLGYVEGKNIFIDFRWAVGKYDRFPELVAELVSLKVDVIVTQGTPAALASKRATTTPIVMALIGDAVATGVVTSLARPGGTITGSSYFVPELMAKRIELLKEALARIDRIAVLLNPDNPLIGSVLKAMETTARRREVEIQQFLVRQPLEFENAFSSTSARRVDGVVVLEEGMFLANAKAIADLAAKQRLPSIGFAEYAEAGGFLGYGPDLPALFRRAAYFVDKILKGAKPADLPIEQPTKYELVINLKTAKALGLTIRQSLLQRADQVIE